MTNAEKFEQVFGFEHNKERCPFPVETCKELAACNDCALVDFWDKEYKPCFKLKSEYRHKAEVTELENLHLSGYTC